MIRERYYCGLDIGSQRIKAGILKIKDIHTMELIGVYERKTEGLKNASVSDLGELSECIHGTVHTLMKKTGIKLKEVQLGVGGELVDIRESRAVIPLIDRGSKIITATDIKKVNRQAHLLGLNVEEEVLHDLPQYYLVDDVDVALNPHGLYGRRLGIHSFMIIVNVNRIRNMMRAVHQAGYDVAHVFFSSYAASEIALNDQERLEGCILIDIGSQSTRLLIFKEGHLKYFRKISSGGDACTHRIAQQLNLPFDLAEEIKKSYASVLSTEQDHAEEILVKRENAYVPIQRGSIYQAIEPEIESFLEGLQTVIHESGLSEHMNRGVVMIGGGSLLSGMMERISQRTSHAVRLGKINIAAKRSLGNAALFSPVVGLARSGFKKSFKYTFSSHNNHPRWGGHMIQRVKELYQEYF